MAKPNVVNKKGLIEAAKACLVEKGIEKFTLKAVAEKAGVVQGTVYYHFRTKDQLLLEIVNDICSHSWNAIVEHPDERSIVQHALASAKNRYNNNFFFHKLFFTLTIKSFNNEQMRERISEILQEENELLHKKLSQLWAESPILGVSLENWGRLINAMIDGLAIQVMMSDEFPIDEVYAELENLFVALNKFAKHK